MNIENLSTLKIHKLTQAQYDRELEAGRIDINALYLTPNEASIMEETDPTVPAWAKEPTKPTYTANEVGADVAGAANNAISEHNNSTSSHSDMRSMISGLTNTVNTIGHNIAIISEGKANKNGLTLGVHTDGLVYLFVDGVPHGNGLDIKADVVDGDVFGYVDENNVIVLNGALADGIYTIKYEMEDGSTIDIGNLELESNVYYSVTNNLINCITSNSATQVAKDSSYSATITANDGYTIDTIVVSMEGGGHYNISGNIIDIPNITGNIYIHATAIVESDEPVQNYTNLAEPNTDNTTDFSIWCNNARIGSDGTASARDGYVSTNFVAVKPGDVVRFKNFKTERLCFYGADKTPVDSGIQRPNSHIVNSKIITNVSGDANVTTDANAEPTEMTFTIVTAGSAANIAFMRLSGHLTGDAEDVIITVNEEIVENGTIDSQINYFDASTATLNHRIGSSGSLSVYDGIVVSDYIPVDSSMYGKLFRITGVSPVNNTTYKYVARTSFYAPDTKAFLTGSHTNYEEKDWGGWVYPWSTHITTDTAYIRISLVIKDNVAITADDIKDIKITLE